MTEGLRKLLEKYNITDVASFESELNKELAETHVPKTVFNETNEKLKMARQESADKDKLLEESKSGKADFDSLKSQYDELVKKHKADMERYDAEMLATRKSYAVDSELSRHGVRNSKAFKALLDDSKIGYENESVTGLLEQIEAIRKSDPYMFVEPPSSKPTWGTGKSEPAGAGDSNNILTAMGV